MIDKHYLAGFFDGEGCIFTCIKKSKHPKKTYLYPDLNVSIGQSGEEGKQILLEIKELFPQFGKLQKKKARGLTKQAPYTIVTSGRKAVSFLKEMYPFLILKQKQAVEAINYMESYYESRKI